MEKFSLDKYLENPSRKVTTRLGNREVRIICYDRKNNNNKPIVTLMIDPDGNEYITFHTKNGFVDETEKYIDKRDLFFADEDEELTEFEKAISEFIQKLTFNGNVLPSKDIKGYSKTLLDLARKERKKGGLWDAEKVIKFIKDNVREYHKSGVFHIDDFINGLRKSMEEE